MAVIRPMSASMQLTLSLGQEGGREVTKSVSIAGLDVNATPDSLLIVANALGSLLAYPTVMVRHSAYGVITE